jgi:hypothetical protein
MKLSKTNPKFFIFVVTIFFTACQAPLNIDGSAAAMSPLKVRLTYNIEPVKNGKLMISGETNLPDDTNLNIRVMGTSVKYDVSFETKVQTGKFYSQEFSADAKALPTGEYKAAVAMNLSTLQPSHVRAVIGKNGEHITGDIVRRYENSAAAIEVRKKFHLQPDGTIIIAVKPNLEQ